jgi:amino acid permease
MRICECCGQQIDNKHYPWGYFELIALIVVFIVLAGTSAVNDIMPIATAFSVIAILFFGVLLVKYLDSGSKFQDVDERRRESNTKCSHP